MESCIVVKQITLPNGEEITMCVPYEDEGESSQEPEQEHV